MFTSEEYQKLKVAALILYDKGLLRALSEKSLVCLLALLCNNEPVDSLPGVTRRLGWSEKRTSRYLSELMESAVVVVIPSQRKESGQITPRCYRLALTVTTQIEKPKPVPKSGTQDRTPILDPKVGHQSQYPKSDPGRKSDFKPKTASNNPPSGQKCPWCHGQNHNTKTPSCCCINKTTTKGGLQRGENADPQHDSPKRATQEKSQLVEQLVQAGIEDDTAKELVENYPPFRIANQLEMLGYRSARDKPAVLIGSIRKNYSPPVAYLDSKKQPDNSALCPNETQARFAHIRSEDALQLKRMKRLMGLEKQLSVSEKNTLRRDAEKRVRQNLRRAWPRQKPIPETFLKAEYYRLISAQCSKRESGATSQPKNEMN